VETIRPDVLTALGLPTDPDALLADHARMLDFAYREVGGRLAVNAELRVDELGKIHLTGVKAVEEPPSLVDLHNRTTAMLPRVDLPEVILEVMSWEPSLAQAFIAASGWPIPTERSADLDRRLFGRNGSTWRHTSRSSGATMITRISPAPVAVGPAVPAVSSGGSTRISVPNSAGHSTPRRQRCRRAASDDPRHSPTRPASMFIGIFHPFLGGASARLARLGVFPMKRKKWSPCFPASSPLR
jgi:hypothetical protein